MAIDDYNARNNVETASTHYYTSPIEYMGELEVKIHDQGDQIHQLNETMKEEIEYIKVLEEKVDFLMTHYHENINGEHTMLTPNLRGDHC